jgi:hypothetical protein
MNDPELQRQRCKNLPTTPRAHMYVCSQVHFRNKNISFGVVCSCEFRNRTIGSSFSPGRSTTQILVEHEGQI